MATKTKLSRQAPPPMPELSPEEKAAREIERNQAWMDSSAESFDEYVDKAVKDLESIYDRVRTLTWEIGDLASTMSSIRNYAEWMLHSQARGATITSKHATATTESREAPASQEDINLYALSSLLTIMRKASEHEGKLTAARNAMNGMSGYF